jgi:hypothetical protein
MTLQTTTVNTELVQWLDSQIERIESATDGRKRYHAYRGAMDDVACNAAPLTVRFTEKGYRPNYFEKAICLQALAWCASAAGVKPATVAKVFKESRNVL